jgi:hypothetical protein
MGPSPAPDGWRPPVPGPPAWFDFGGRRFYRLPTGYYAARDHEQPGRLHMAIWEDVNARAIPAGHVVHHVDHDPENNDPGNLAVMSHGDHDRHHRTGLKRTSEARARIQAGVADSWARRQPRTFVCEWCRAEFESLSSRTEVRYCSRQCRKLGLKQSRGIPVFTRAERPCDECGKPFMPKDGRSHFCSCVCAGDSLSRQRKAARK